MADYRIFLKPSAAKELEALPSGDLLRIVARIESLSAEPRPAGSIKLSGRDEYRLRQGDYRILYSVDDAERTVVVVRIGHRRDVYRG